MSQSTETITDFITGQKVPNVGAEENRQKVELFLVNSKGYRKSDIEVNLPIAFSVQNQVYESCLDLVVSVNGRRFMVIKCAAGSLGSREREAIAAARILETAPLPLAVVSDGDQAIVLDPITGQRLGNSMEDIPTPSIALEKIKNKQRPEPLPADRLEKERLIFRSYDSMNVNVAHRIGTDKNAS